MHSLKLTLDRIGSKLQNRTLKQIFYSETNEVLSIKIRENKRIRSLHIYQRTSDNNYGRVGVVSE
jgi:hypothetical protein